MKIGAKRKENMIIQNVTRLAYCLFVFFLNTRWIFIIIIKQGTMQFYFKMNVCARVEITTNSKKKKDVKSALILNHGPNGNNNEETLRFFLSFLLPIFQ